MKKVINLISSYTTTFVLLIQYILLIAIATFVELNGTPEANYLVYDATYFNILSLLLAFNLIAIVIKKKLYKPKKLTIFIFHLGFIVILLGAAITHFVSFSGTMHIRQGESADFILSDSKYLNIDIDDGNYIYHEDFPVILNNYLILSHKVKYNNNKYIIKFKGIQYSGNVRFALFEIENNGKTFPLKFSYSQEMQNTSTVNVNGYNITISYGAKKIQIPFSLKLDKFELTKYPGSMSPMSYKSFVELNDTERGVNENHEIFMNNVLDYRGYRFFQSSYDTDEMGTILSVNHDFWGTLFTYLGYALMSLGMFLSIFNKSSRFRILGKKLDKITKATAKAAILILFFSLSTNLSAQNANLPQVDKTHADEFGQLYILGTSDRIEPVNTYTSEIVLKLTHHSTIEGLDPNQVLLSMFIDSQSWFRYPILKIKDESLKQKLNINKDVISLADLFSSDGTYKLQQFVSVSYQKNPATRNNFDRDVIKLDEKANILYTLIDNASLRIFPDKQSDMWYSPEVMMMTDSSEYNIIFNNYLQALKKSYNSSDWSFANEALKQIENYQTNNISDEYISKTKLKAEIFYYKTSIFRQLFELYFTLGLLYVAFLFFKILFEKLKMKWFDVSVRMIIYLAFAAHTFGLILRWYISGHAPWSNGYESMIYIGWATLLAGIIFQKKNKLTLAATTVLAGIILLVAHLSWMDPQITNLVPVLQSYWLTLHVAIITASYGFLFLGALLGTLVMILMILYSKKNQSRITENIKSLTIINEMALIAGLFLLSIGTFLGGIWANQSWGTYWSWDPKETWSLISMLVYALVLHIRLIPKVKESYTFLFNMLSLWAISSIIMTFFGVNYFLSGLHSYGASSGNPTMPSYVYYTVIVFLIISLFSSRKYQKYIYNYK